MLVTTYLVLRPTKHSLRAMAHCREHTKKEEATCPKTPILVWWRGGGRKIPFIYIDTSILPIDGMELKAQLLRTWPFFFWFGLVLCVFGFKSLGNGLNLNLLRFRSCFDNWANYLYLYLYICLKLKFHDLILFYKLSCKILKCC